MTQTPTGRPCPKCGGSGRIFDIEEGWTVACEYCDGTDQGYTDLPSCDGAPVVREPEGGE